ncbi:MAG: hypothetical protein V1874_04425 [Spirochaetota bacterium]
MKKNMLLASVAFLIFIISSINFSSAASGKLNAKIFTGRIIFVADNYIELKKGKTEIRVYIAENTKFIARDGKESGKNIIRICQYVEAYYSEESGKMNLDKIIIKKESDCVK